MANGSNWTRAKKNAYQKAWYKVNKGFISKTNVSNITAGSYKLVQGTPQNTQQTPTQNQQSTQPNNQNNTKQNMTGGRVFTSMSEAATYFGVGTHGAYDNWEASLTHGEKNGVYVYTGSGYIPMNAALRNGTTPTPQIAKAIKGAQAAIAKAELKDDIIVWRGSSSKIFGGGKLTVADFQNMAKNGIVIHDDGFTSAGITRDKAWGKAYVMKIKVPAGKGRGQYVAPMSQHKGEGEYLCHNNGDYAIKGAYQEGNKIIVECELVK